MQFIYTLNAVHAQKIARSEKRRKKEKKKNRIFFFFTFQKDWQMRMESQYIYTQKRLRHRYSGRAKFQLHPKHREYTHFIWIVRCCVVVTLLSIPSKIDWISLIHFFSPFPLVVAAAVIFLFVCRCHWLYWWCVDFDDDDEYNNTIAGEA